MSDLFVSIKNTNRPFVIAEIGANFYDIASKNSISLLDAALLMIEKAAGAGADAVKFQSYKAHTIAVKNSPAYWNLNEEPCLSQYELFSKYDSFGPEEYNSLAKYCSAQGVQFLSTPFDFEAVDYLVDLCPVYKVSSSDITNWPFLEYIARKGKPVLLSTGASSAAEVCEAVSVLERYGNGEICVLHCILCYPTAYQDANIRMIEHLGLLFPHHLLGYSDHTRPDPTMTCLSYACQLGAKVIEKHFSLDKKMPGNDHYHSMDPDDLKKFINNVSLEHPILDQAIVSKISGESEKRVILAEEPARLNARRSIVAIREIKAGETISRKMVTFKRPGTGYPPKDLDKIVGLTAKTNIPGDTIITRELLE